MLEVQDGLAFKIVEQLGASPSQLRQQIMRRLGG
jgi:hypothetical protein